MTKNGLSWLKIFFDKKNKKRRRRREKINWKKKLLYYIPVLFFLGIIVSFLLILVSFAWVAKSLPSPDQVVRREGFATRISDRNDETLYDVFRGEKRTPVAFESIPNDLKWATIAIEDKEFYSHPGFSVRGIARAAFNIVFKHRLQGGSTLTQQLVKNVLLTSDRTISRKYKEFILALQIERKYNKDEILQMYLNEAPYGGTAWGVGAAAEQYFNKHVSELSLVESAVLAGLPQRPTAYSPYHSDLWQERTKGVLRQMNEEGYISSEQREESEKKLGELTFHQGSEIKAPHFVMNVRDTLAQKYGVEAVELEGLKVKTSLDLELQEEVEDVVEEELDKVEYLNITNGAVVVLNAKNGEVLSMVGSKDYFDQDNNGKFNVITQGLRQPGSAIKPVTYLTGFKKGYTASTLLMDTKTVFPVVGQDDYVPVNYDGKFHGPMQVRYALGNSINIPAVKMLAKVGLKSVLATAYELGIDSLQPTNKNLSKLGLSVTLGGGSIKPIEMAQAYLAFANGGLKQEASNILEIKDKKEKVIFEKQAVEGERVMSEEQAFLISDILSDNSARSLTFGEASGLVIPGKKVAVKTGTTNDKRDNWAVGWTPDYLVLVWVGNNDNSPMKKVASGVSGATPIWRRVMMLVIDKYGYSDFKVPEGIVRAEVDRVSGYRSHDGFPARMEYFVKGSVPEEKDPVHLKLKVCHQSGKLATPPQVAQGDYEEKEFFMFKEEDPVSQDGKNRWQEGILGWIQEQNDSRYNPPTEYCEEGGLIEVTIDSPAHESTVSNNFPVDIKVRGVNKIKTVKVFVDDDEKKTFTEKPYKMDLTLEKGTYVLRVWAKDVNGNTGEREAYIGVSLPWDWQPSPTPTETPKPTSTPKPSPTDTPEPTATNSPTLTSAP